MIVFFNSIVIHEVAHGSVAIHLGDPTAKYAGRLTLNPLKHLDPIGSVLLPLVLLLVTFGQGPIFGWAKPVPINPFNFKDKRWGSLKVAIAGPLVNFAVAVIFGLIIRFVSLSDTLLLLFSIISIYNFLWGIFNLVPVPPLDGSHILFSFLPDGFGKLRFFLHQYGFYILILLIFMGGLRFLFSGANFLFYFVTGQSLGI